MGVVKLLFELGFLGLGWIFGILVVVGIGESRWVATVWPHGPAAIPCDGRFAPIASPSLRRGRLVRVCLGIAGGRLLMGLWFSGLVGGVTRFTRLGGRHPPFIPRCPLMEGDWASIAPLSLPLMAFLGSVRKGRFRLRCGVGSDHLAPRPPPPSPAMVAPLPSRPLRSEGDCCVVFCWWVGGIFSGVYGLVCMWGLLGWGCSLN